MNGTQTPAPHGAYANASVIKVHPVVGNATPVVREAVARLGVGGLHLPRRHEGTH